METKFSQESYDAMLSALFQRFPSFQNTGKGAYKPGIENMYFFDQLAGHPHRSYKVIHVAGTNGKGSVSNMLASVLDESGLKVGLYTSPHILDFRERMRVASKDAETGEVHAELVSREYVWDFVQKWNSVFGHVDMSFFEITTVMAMNWFAERAVDVAVIETGLGGRLDSTNIVEPVLSIITNIGLDHCDLLGDTLPEIAFEKAGIIKPKVPVVVGESHPETESVFERKVIYTNLSEPEYMGSRPVIMNLLTFADKVEPSLWNMKEELLKGMDLKGDYQKKNLRTVLAALDVLRRSDWSGELLARTDEGTIVNAIKNTSSFMGFHGRWEKLCSDPLVIGDIGHNEHGLKYNFAQLSDMKRKGECTELIIVYGSVADKDVDAVLRLIPEDAYMIFTHASGKRALGASLLKDKFVAIRQDMGVPVGRMECIDAVEDAVKRALELAAEMKSASDVPVIYVGGSTYVVSEAVASIS